MATEIRVTTLGESVTEATIAQWFKKPGDAIVADEPLVELETDKVTIEVPAPAAGVLGEILVGDGETVEVGALLGTVGEGTGAAPAAKAPAAKAEEAPAPAKAAEPAAGTDMPPSPAAKKLLAEKGLSADDVQGSGKRGQVLKEDVAAAASKPAAVPVAVTSAPAPEPVVLRVPSAPADEAREERVRMTKLRQTIARRLKDAQSTAAMLTTFNEVDMVR